MPDRPIDHRRVLYLQRSALPAKQRLDSPDRLDLRGIERLRSGVLF